MLRVQLGMQEHVVIVELARRRARLEHRVQQRAIVLG
jgi:hypothetical protein